MNYCTRCGHKVSEHDNFCTNCGYSLNNINYKQFTEDSEEKFFNKNIYSKNENKIANNIIVAFLLLIVTLGAFEFFEELTLKRGIETGRTPTVNKNIINKEEPHYFNDIIYQNKSAGIYVFKIQPENFKKDDFLKYAQTLPRSVQGDSSFVFVFNKPVITSIIDTMLNTTPYNIPLYTTDILWKQYPYFYYSDAFGLKQYYCEINGLQQKYYERNQALLYDETTFLHKYNLTAPKGFGLSSLNGCNPEYVPDTATIQQEMNLVTLSSGNLQSILQDNKMNKQSTEPFQNDDNVNIKQDALKKEYKKNITNDTMLPGDSDTLLLNNSPKIKQYMDYIQKRIKMNWFPPNIKASSKVTVVFTVAKDGSLIGEPNIKRASGIDKLDKSCINAVILSAPFRSLPEELKEDSTDIEFSFDYNYK